MDKGRIAIIEIHEGNSINCYKPHLQEMYLTETNFWTNVFTLNGLYADAMFVMIRAVASINPWFPSISWMDRKN